MKASATKSDLAKAYRHQSLRLHPDKNPGKEAEYQPKFVAVLSTPPSSSEAFSDMLLTYPHIQQLKAAFDILNHDAHRASYNQTYRALAHHWARYRAFTRKVEDARRTREDRKRQKQNARRSREDHKRQKDANRRAGEDARRKNELGTRRRRRDAHRQGHQQARPRGRAPHERGAQARAGGRRARTPGG